MSTPAFFQGFLSHERGLFSSVIAAIPEDRKDYQPEPKARTAEQLVEHLIGHNLDLIELLDDGVIHHRNFVPFDTIEDGVQQFDETFGTILDKLGSMDQEQWTKGGEFWAGEHLVMEAPCVQLAWMMFLDSIHHRGQLTTYLRPMGSKVPSIYGPSADDQGEGH